MDDEPPQGAELWLTLLVGHLRATGWGDTADDIAQEVIIIALKNEEIMQRDYWRPWLFGVLQKKIAEFRRASQRRAAGYARLSASSSACSAHDPSDYVEAERRLGLLTEIQQQAILCFEYWGMTGPEAAAALGITTDAATQRLRSARKHLAAIRESEADRATG